MKCPNCRSEKLIVIPKNAKNAGNVGYYYLECPKPDCFIAEVKEVKVFMDGKFVRR